MKLALVLLTLATPAFAAEATPADVMNQGIALLGKVTILNPIVCQDQAGAVALIYSDDFREADTAYTVANGTLTKADRKALNIQVTGGRAGDEYTRLEIVAAGKPMTCVESSMVLE